MALRLAIFDCDGTLADSEATIVDAIRAAFTEHDLANPARADISAHIGLSLDAFLAAVAPGVDPEKATRIVDSYRQHYARLRTGRGGDPLFPGLAALLPELRENGILLGVATGKSRRGLRKFLEAHGLGPRDGVLRHLADRDEFSALAQNHFESLFPHDHVTAGEMLGELRQLMLESDSLAAYVQG